MRDIIVSHALGPLPRRQPWAFRRWLFARIAIIKEPLSHH
jgi:hypothetical protein